MYRLSICHEYNISASDTSVNDLFQFFKKFLEGIVKDVV